MDTHAAYTTTPTAHHPEPPLASFSAPSRVNFESDLFDATLEHCLGPAIIESARELKRDPRFQARLARSFRVGDTVADKLVVAMRGDDKVRADYETAVSRGLSAVADPCPAVRDFFASIETLPDSLDRDMIELGGEVFRTRANTLSLMLYGIPVGMYLQSAVSGVVVGLWFAWQPRGAPVPLREAACRRELMHRSAVRFMETFRWFGEIAEPGAGALHSEAYALQCRVRIVHAHIRAAICAQKSGWNYSPAMGWDDAALGVPLSAADNSVVATTLVVALAAMQRHFKLEMSAHELDALTQWASYVNYMQGAPEELIFGTYQEAATYFAAFFMCVDPDVCRDEISAMIRAVSHMHLERAMFRQSRLIQTVLDGVLRAAVANMFGERLMANYDVPPAPLWSKPIYWAVKQGIKASNIFAPFIPGGRKFLQNNALKTWTHVFPEAEKAMREHYGTVVDGSPQAVM